MQSITNFLKNDPIVFDEKRSRCVTRPTSFEKRYSTIYMVREILAAIALVGGCYRIYRQKGAIFEKVSTLFTVLSVSQIVRGVVSFILDRLKQSHDHFEDAYRQAFSELLYHEKNDDVEKINEMCRSLAHVTINKTMNDAPKGIQSDLKLNTFKVVVSQYPKKVRRLCAGYLAAVRMLQPIVAKKTQEADASWFMRRFYTVSELDVRRVQYYVARIRLMASSTKDSGGLKLSDYLNRLKQAKRLTMEALEQRLTE